MRFYELNLENHEEMIEALTDLLIEIDAEYTHRHVDVTFSVKESDGKYFGKIDYVVEGGGVLKQVIASHTGANGVTPEDCGAESEEEFVQLLHEMRQDYEDKAIDILDNAAWEIDLLIETEAA